jgi:hypothetical protein
MTIVVVNEQYTSRTKGTTTLPEKDSLLMSSTSCYIMSPAGLSTEANQHNPKL